MGAIPGAAVTSGQHQVVNIRPASKPCAQGNFSLASLTIIEDLNAGHRVGLKGFLEEAEKTTKKGQKKTVYDPAGAPQTPWKVDGYWQPDRSGQTSQMS